MILLKILEILKEVLILDFIWKKLRRVTSSPWIIRKISTKKVKELILNQKIRGSLLLVSIPRIACIWIVLKEVWSKYTRRKSTLRWRNSVVICTIWEKTWRSIPKITIRDLNWCISFQVLGSFNSTNFTSFWLWLEFSWLVFSFLSETLKLTRWMNL